MRGSNLQLKYYGYGWNISAFRFKVLSFEKRQSTSANGIPWSLKLEVVNLLKDPVYDSHIAHNIVITDQDDYSYANYTYNFDSISLNPKLKYSGEITFILPDQDDLELYISAQDGDIQEI
jgi:hypothetical protein